MKEDHTHSLRDVVKKFLKEENLDKTLNEKRLISSWDEMMGVPIANRTTNVAIRNKIMYITLSSAPLKQELTQRKKSVLDIIETKFGKGIIDDIRFL